MTTCPGWDSRYAVNDTTQANRSLFHGYIAPEIPDGYADDANKQLFIFAPKDLGNGSMLMGLMCINTSTAPPALCSTPFYNITSQAMPTDVFYSAALPNKVGNRLFSMDAYHGLLLCWDTTLKAACSGSPYQLNTAQPGANLGNTVNQYFGMAPLESRLIAWTDKAFYCFQTFSSPLALCPGFPLTWNQGAIVGTLSAYVAPPIPHVNVTSGAIDGVCFATGNVCIDFAPATRTDWINPWTNSSVLAAIKAAPGIPYFASYVVFKNRVFIYPAYTPANGSISVWDWSVNKVVANISLNASYLYSMRADPYNPACIWWSTDVKVWSSISPMSYGTCQSIGASDTQLQGEKSNWLCNSRSDLLSRLSITLVNVTGGGAGVAYLTVQRSSDSLLVPGWIGMPLQVGVPVNLSTLSTEQTGPNPIFTFDLGNTTGSPTGYTLEYAWLGRGPELCFNGTINNTGLFVFPIEIEETLANGTVITRTGNRTVNILDAGTPGCGVAASAPSAPYNTTLNTADPTSLAFTVPYDGGSPIEYYEYSQDNTTWVRLSEYDMGGNMRSATLSGIVSCIYLRAVNLVGRGAMTKVCKPITTQTSSTTITRSTTSTATTMTRYTTSTSTWAPASSSSCACYSVAYGNNFLTGFCCNGLPPYGKSYPSFNAAMLAMTQYKCSCGGITLASGSYTLRAGSTLMYSGTEVSWLFNGTYTCDCSRTHP